MHSKRLITQSSRNLLTHRRRRVDCRRKRKTWRTRTWEFPHLLNRTLHYGSTTLALCPCLFSSRSLSLLSHKTALLAVFMLLNPTSMHRRNATLDLPSPRIGGSFPEPEPYSPQVFSPLPASSSSKFGRPRFTISQSLFSRQWLQRTTFLALFSLFSVSVYILLLHGSTNLRPVAIPQQIKSPFKAAMNTFVDSPDRPWRPTHKDVLASRPQITLTPEEELAALSSFIISLPHQNILPPSVDPSQPIDPQLILDFDTRRDGAGAELKRLVTATWENNPVVMYTKVRSLSVSHDRTRN